MHNLVTKHRALDDMRNMRDCTRSYRQEELELYVHRTNAASAIFVVVFFFQFGSLIETGRQKKAIKRGNRE